MNASDSGRTLSQSLKRRMLVVAVISGMVGVVVGWVLAAGTL